METAHTSNFLTKMLYKQQRQQQYKIKATTKTNKQ